MDFELGSKATEHICKNCNETFFLTDTDARFFKDTGMSLPKRCYDCRQKRRDAKRIDLTKHIGRYICRTKATHTGDRSFIGELSKIKLLEVREDGSIVYEGSKFFHDGENQTLSHHYNDGYWKVVKVKEKPSVAGIGDDYAEPYPPYKL